MLMLMSRLPTLTRKLSLARLCMTFWVETVKDLCVRAFVLNITFDGDMETLSGSF